MFSERAIELFIMTAPFIAIAGVMLVGRFTCEYFTKRSLLLENRCSLKKVSTDIDLWHQFLSSKKLKNIEIIEGEFAGFSPSLNMIQMPFNSMSRLNLFDLFVLIHEGMHYYCNQKYLFCHSDLIRILRMYAFTMEIIFVPLVIINLYEVTTFHLIWS